MSVKLNEKKNPRLISTYVSLPYFAMKIVERLADERGKSKSEILRPWILEKMREKKLIK